MLPAFSTSTPAGWQLLGAVKTGFGEFGAVLDKIEKNLDQASNRIDATGVFAHDRAQAARRENRTGRRHPAAPGRPTGTGCRRRRYGLIDRFSEAPAKHAKYLHPVIPAKAGIQGLGGPEGTGFRLSPG